MYKLSSFFRAQISSSRWIYRRNMAELTKKSNCQCVLPPLRCIYLFGNLSGVLMISIKPKLEYLQQEATLQGSNGGFPILSHQPVGCLHPNPNKLIWGLHWNQRIFPVLCGCTKAQWYRLCVISSYKMINNTVNHEKKVIFTPLCVPFCFCLLIVCGISSKRLRGSSGNLKPRWVSPVHVASSETNTPLNASKFDVKWLTLFYH